MKLTDTHCHLYLDPFEEDLNEVLARAVDTGVTSICLPAIDWQSLEAMDRLVEAAHNSVGDELRFYKMAGIHPCDVEKNRPLDGERLHQAVSRDDIIAVGETGLDYYWSRDHMEEQRRSLEIHCEVAKTTGKPVVLHNRESTLDLLDLIESRQDGRLKGVWHCFNGSPDEGRRALDLGLCLGIGGVLTFKNAGVDKTVRELPLDHMILETDAPYLAPAPHRGKRNEPAYVGLVAEKLAEIFETSLEEIAGVTTRNAGMLFGLLDEA